VIIQWSMLSVSTTKYMLIYHLISYFLVKPKLSNYLHTYDEHFYRVTLHRFIKRGCAAICLSSFSVSFCFSSVVLHTELAFITNDTLWVASHLSQVWQKRWKVRFHPFVSREIMYRVSFRSSFLVCCLPLFFSFLRCQVIHVNSLFTENPLWSVSENSKDITTTAMLLNSWHHPALKKMQASSSTTDVVESTVLIYYHFRTA